MDDDRTSVENHDRYRQLVIRELVETERKYVWDLELLQQYVETASATVPYETLRRLFPNLKGILELHRAVVVQHERMYDLPWQAQRWGAVWVEMEQELFVAYEPWCTHYNAAMELLYTIVLDLDPYDHLISSKSELSALLLKPVSRIHKYPLLLRDLLKTTRRYEYPWYNEVVEADNAIKRLHAQLNEANTQAENSLIAERLRTRVADWKGHDPADFGELIQDNVFAVVHAGVPLEYHIFLFENILLCAREVVRRKKPRQPLHWNVVPSKMVTPLVLDGRIFVADIARTVPSSQDGFSLAVWWRDDDVMQQFTLQCRTEDQMDRWHKKIAGLIGGDGSDDEFWCPGE